MKKKDAKNGGIGRRSTWWMAFCVFCILLHRQAPEAIAQASVSGYAWMDENNDGIQDTSERGFSGILVQLFRQVSVGQHVEMTSLRTESSGHFLFILSGDLLPGEYYLQFETASGFFYSPADMGVDDSKDSDVDQNTGRTAIFHLENNDNANAWSAGYAEESVTPPPAHQADLSLIEFADRTQVHVGDTLRYTIEVTNTGPDTAIAVQVLLPHSAALSILSADPASGDIMADPLSWIVPWLAPNSTWRIFVAAQLINDGSLAEAACVSSMTLDPNPSNNCYVSAIDIEVPVELASFTAMMQNDGVHLKWITQSESENMGFHLFRAEPADEIFQQITSRLLPGHGTTAVRHHYEYVDQTVEKDKRYHYQLRDFDYEGRTVSHGPIEVSTSVPELFSLSQNYPNPFNATTRIEFILPQSGHVELKVFNAAGQVVRTLMSGELAAGCHQVQWDGLDHQGGPVASSMYIYSLSVDGQHSFRRMQLVK